MGIMSRVLRIADIIMKSSLEKVDEGLFVATQIIGGKEYNIYVEGNKAVMIEVNAETDFVSKNEEFTEMIKNIGETILNSDAKTLEEANELAFEDGTIKDYVVAKTAKIGEKLSLRRFEIVEKNDEEAFGNYLHMGGKIAALTVVKGVSEEVARDVSMQAAAMNPLYLDETEVPEEVVARESEVFKTQAMEEGKPADIAEKMVEGISEKLTDPYSKLTKKMKKYTYNKFKCLFKCLEEESITCKKDMC